MRITAKADYAVRAAVELAAAADDDRPVKGEHLARVQGIPQNFLENILTELRRAGIVRTRRGVEGGYRGATTELRNESGHHVPMPLISVTGRIRWRKSVNLGPYKFLRSIAKQTPKVTMPAPQTLFFFATRDTISRDHYPDLSLLWSDLADAYKSELKALSDAGCTYVQLDEIVTSCLCDDAQRQKLKTRGQDPDELLHTYVRTINRAIAGRSPTR